MRTQTDRLHSRILVIYSLTCLVVLSCSEPDKEEGNKKEEEKDTDEENTQMEMMMMAEEERDIEGSKE